MTRHYRQTDAEKAGSAAWLVLVIVIVVALAVGAIGAVLLDLVLG